MAKAGDRKPRSSSRRRHHILQRRVDGDELVAFQDRARTAGFDDHRDYLSALIGGDAGFDRRDRQDLIRLLGELGKHGSNLNQIAHGINSGRVTRLAAADIEKVDAARAAVEAAAGLIREALGG